MVCFVFRNIVIFFMMIHPPFALGVKEAVNTALDVRQRKSP